MPPPRIISLTLSSLQACCYTDILNICQGAGYSVGSRAAVGSTTGTFKHDKNKANIGQTSRKRAPRTEQESKERTVAMCFKGCSPVGCGEFNWGPKHTIAWKSVMRMFNITWMIKTWAAPVILLVKEYMFSCIGAKSCTYPQGYFQVSAWTETKSDFKFGAYQEGHMLHSTLSALTLQLKLV